MGLVAVFRHALHVLFRSIGLVLAAVFMARAKCIPRTKTQKLFITITLQPLLMCHICCGEMMDGELDH